MDNDTKVTYVVIVVLIIVLGTVSYFLQDHVTLPGDIKNQVASAEDAINNIKRTESTSKKELLGTSTNSTTTTAMQLPEKITSATITTNKGEIEIIFATNTPNTVKNFGTLAFNKFYDGTRFHRVIKGFMIQGGDPLSKDLTAKDRWGTGGPDYRFNDELTGKEQYPEGTVAMANAGPNTNGSQFFIVTASPAAPLPPSYTVFGKVTKGLDVAMQIQNVQTDPNDRPLQDVIIEKVEIH